jgi:predicted Zn-dependent protease
MAARITPRASDSYIPPGLDPSGESSSTDFARQGERAFRDGEYKRAAREWRHAILDDTQNGTLVLMMSQALFQMGNFNEAAGAVQAGLQMLPRDKWNVVVANFRELYGDTQDYIDQLKELEKAVKEKPKEPGLRLLVGYHYLYLGYPAEAIRELKAGEELAKTDKAMKELIKIADDELLKKQGEQVPKPPEPATTPAKPDVE